MNDLQIKHVDFLGDTLIEAKDSNGDVWVGVSYVCNGIGLTKNEKDRQVKKVQADKVLKRGCVKFDAGVFDPYNETIAIKLDYLPLWLAKIPITPSMEADSPDVADKLEAYQLKAKDVLASAFVSQSIPEVTPNIMSLSGFASTVNTLRRIMRDEGSTAAEIAQMAEGLCKQFGIHIPDNFVKEIPGQLTLFGREQLTIGGNV